MQLESFGYYTASCIELTTPFEETVALGRYMAFGCKIKKVL